MIRKNLAAVSLAIAMSAVVLPSHVGAMTVEFTPIVGVLTPMNSQVAAPEGPIVIRQESATVFGARVGAWIIPRVGVEASFLTGSSSLQLVGGTVIGLDALMINLDLRARLRLNDPADNTGFDFILGAGISDLNDPISDFGEDQGIETPSQWMLVVGLGATIPISDKIRMRFDVEDHIHDANFELDEVSTGYPVENRTQNDIVITAGIVILPW